MISLSDKNWSMFSLGDKSIFDLHSTVNGIDKNKLNLSGENIYPYVTRTDNNNGIANFIPVQNKDVNPGNTISIGLDTQTVFYQPSPYYTGQNIQVLNYKHVNLKTANFLIPLIQKQLENLNWGGNGATLTRLKAKKIMLPVDNNNQPDWQFMENYISEKMGGYNVPSLETSGIEPLDLHGRKWKNFKIGSFFELKRGSSGPKSKLEKGKTPLISARKLNNGLDNFVTPLNASKLYKNVLTINNNGDGGAGISFYQKFSFVGTQDVTIMIPLFSNFNQFIFLFLTVVITKQRGKFGFGNKVNSVHLSNQKIMLPVDNNNQPDWQFMENYIKSLPNSNLI
ncbi:restriction endonuclease subunit S [Companilactobacillus sp.]|uniref:restriction endonuclease subunit S n=1 Tax=Companilactobacillus sp. TaxID=2767905 RepID=UPI002601DBEF|nr:restriction endonuclease subunit S [Companilactobacillus sp.]